jgi:2-succinyl-6-hydroxy-2,4-cyclohexadiene-1-carboxylate synthase
VRRVLVHGFTQTAASWGGVLDGEAVPVVPGDDLWSTAAALADAAPDGPADWVGYSMGGRLALHVALAYPQRVRRLVLLGAHPGIEGDTERAARRAADEALAERLERIGVDAFLAEWLAQPLFAGLADPGPRQRDPQVLAACLRRLGTGAQEPLWGRLGELAGPVLVLAGERDEKYVALGRRLAAAIGTGRAEFATVPDAGHAAHLEQPAAFRRLVKAFLA